MGDRGTARRQDPKVLTLSQIRTRVEHLAEELARRLQGSQTIPFQGGLEAIPVDNRVFIDLMAGYINPN